MKILATYDRKDYDLSFPRLIKNSARAIIVVDNKVAMLYSSKYDFYCFPGGGIENEETHIEALVRETKEEAGLIVKPQSVKEFGMITEIRKDIYIEGIYEQREFYYLCDIEDEILEQSLTQSEKDAGYQLSFVTFDEAIAKNELELQIGKIYTEAETYVLKLLKNVFSEV
jgi:8-oxo-dGTP pyrophosphatase MutT (NUDIX family)